MTMQSRLWRIDSDQPKQLAPSQLQLEERLENWLCHDVHLLSRRLMVIGRQVVTEGGTLDILAVDDDANLVVVELKRDKTVREVVAQTLDYASCIQEFGRAEVENYARDYLKKDFDEAFSSHFGVDAPESVNERQRMYIVASSFDPATSRIVEYLSRDYGVDINAVTFSYFQTEYGEFVVRSVLLDEDGVEKRAEDKDTKKQSTASEWELREMASNAGVCELWDIAVDGFCQIATKKRSQTTMFFQTNINGGKRALLTLFPTESSSERGLAVSIVFEHFSQGLGIKEESIREVCGDLADKAFYGSYSTEDNSYYLQKRELEELVSLLQNP